MALENFTFTGADGKKYTLPRPKTGVLRKATREARNESEMIFMVIEGVADKATLAAIDDLDPEAFATVSLDYFEGLRPKAS